MSDAHKNEQTPLVQGLAVGAVYVVDLDRSRAFYEGLLGLRFLRDMKPGVLLAAGETSIYLEGGRDPAESPGTSRTGLSLCFSCASVREASARLLADGVSFVQEYRELAPDFAMFRVADPDGHVVEFAGQP